MELRADEPRLESQVWFWTEEWQAGEREVDEHIARGELTTFDSVDELVEYLSAMPDE